MPDFYIFLIIHRLALYQPAKEKRIEEITCDVHLYNNEDEILQDLLETNIRQRGDVGGSAKKVGKRIKELERIYGIEHGGNRNSQDEKIRLAVKPNLN